MEQFTRIIYTLPVMNTKYDAVILAGDKSGSKVVCGKNKLFLEIQGTPLLLFVLKALEGVERVGKKYVVGPKKGIEELLHKHSGQIDNEGIIVVEQEESMLQNFWSAFTRTITGYYEGIEKKVDEIREKMVLVLPCDLPFITSSEINEFLDSCATGELDYCIGMTKEKYLKKFYPMDSNPGIKMNYLYLREGNFRLNNLHLVRPFKIYNRKYIEKIYARRYQTNIINVAKIFFYLMQVQGFGIKAIFTYSMLELSILLNFLGMDLLGKITKNGVSQSEMRGYACKLLNTRIDIVQTTIGGTALDIDKKTDYETVKARFREWMEILERT